MAEDDQVRPDDLTETRSLDEPMSEAETRRLDDEPAFMSEDADAPTRRVDAPEAETRRLDQPEESTETRRLDADDRDRAVWKDEQELVAERRPAKTSAAAFFGFLFGFSALVTAFLGPVAVVFGILGLLLGIAGRRRSSAEARVSGGAIATTGIVFAVLGLVLGLAVTGALGLYANDPSTRDALRDAWETFRDTFETLPTLF